MTEPIKQRAGVERYGPGEQVENPEPGDFILTHGNAWTSRLIRFGQGLRFRGDDRKYTYWNHTAIFVDDQANIVEALGAGVRPAVHISKYKQIEYWVVRLRALTEDRQQSAQFALRCVGQPYGFVTIVSIALSLLTGTKFSFGFAGQKICSGLVARALERTGVFFEPEPSHIMPAELAKMYGVEPPPPSPPTR
jgi:uncharacterized protein YycO